MENWTVAAVVVGAPGRRARAAMGRRDFPWDGAGGEGGTGQGSRATGQDARQRPSGLRHDVAGKLFGLLRWHRA